MPEPTEPGRHYVAGLDGIRALAVVAVILYHLGFGWAAGGMLGVGVFFTLSGYLITDLLLNRWKRHGDLGLRTFWLRRARRLLPALFTMLAVVSVLVAVFDSGALGQLRRQTLSAVLYFANWSTIAQHGSYFARFAPPLPLDHLWSLSIEEQFYLLWPLVLLAGIWLTRGRVRLALLTLVLAAASLVVMGSLYHPGYDPTRVYEGTDTRAFGLLVGAALAMVLPSRLTPAAGRARAVRALDVLGVAGLAGIALLVWRTSPLSSFLYPIGFLLLSLATAMVIAAAVNRGSQLGAALGCRPLRWIGVRSYAIYLWQWPIIVLLSPGPGPQPLGRAAIEVAITLVVAALSWRFLEDPIRHGALVRLRRRLTSGSQAALANRRALAASGVIAALLLPVLGLTGLLPAVSRTLHGRAVLLRTIPHPLLTSATRSASSPPQTSPQRSGSPPQFVVRGTPSSIDPPGSTAEGPASALTSRRSSCRSVVYIGDSTSEGETSTDYIPNPALRLPNQLARVGVRTVYADISGARSIVEIYKNFPNAATVATGHISAGYHGCWILALGTNDVADIHTGSSVGLAARIDRMMRIIGHQPVLWVDAVTLVRPGSPYAENGMQVWNRDLVQACSRYRTMRVFDWAAHVQRKWFIPDGIHYYSPGYVARSHLISRALAEAFPAGGGASPTCVVR